MIEFITSYIFYICHNSFEESFQAIHSNIFIVERPTYGMGGYNNEVQRPYTGGGYTPSGYNNRANENFEDILDSLKGDEYNRRDDSGYFGNDAGSRGYTAPDGGRRRGHDYDIDRRGTGPISVDNRSMPDLDRSRASSREDDIRSIQPQNLGTRGNQGPKPSWLGGGSGSRGVSTGEDKRRSNYRNDESPSRVGNIDIIESPSSRRRTRTADSRPKPAPDVNVPRFGDVFKDQDRPSSKPPLYNKPSFLEEDDKHSQLRGRDDARSGRFKQDDDTISGYAHSAISGEPGRRRRGDDDNASEYGSRRRVDDKDKSYNTNEGVPALETSVSRRSNKFARDKTPGFRRDDSQEESKLAAGLSGGARNTDPKPTFGSKNDDIQSFTAGSPEKKRAWQKVNENKRIESLSPTQKANQERILKIYEDIKEEEKRRKDIEAEYRQQIKQMKEKHEAALAKMQPPKNIEEERKELIRSLAKKLDREIERIQKQHEANMDIEESQHKANLEREKLLAEQHSVTIKRQLEQQIHISDLVKEVQSSSNKLESIMKSNLDASESTMREFQKKVLQLESEVNQNLTRLVIKQRNYNDMTKKLENLKKDYEFNNNRSKVEKNKLIEEATLLKLRVENEKSKQKRIEQLLEQELAQKEQELEQEKSRLEREKHDAEDQQREYEKKIQLKYLEIDERKKNLAENETYLLKKVQGLDSKNDTVKRESEALRYKVEQLDEERNKFQEKAYMAQQTSIKVFEESEFVSVHKKEYEDDRAELEKLRYELEAEKAHIRAEHLRMEQKRTEILMRERMLDQLKLNRVQEDLDTHQRLYQSEDKIGVGYEPFSFVNSKTDFYKTNYDAENYSPNKYEHQSASVKNSFIKPNIPKSPLYDEKAKETESESHKMYDKLTRKVARSDKKLEPIGDKITDIVEPVKSDYGRAKLSDFSHAKESGLSRPNYATDVRIEDENKDAFDFNQYDDDDDDYTEEDEN